MFALTMITNDVLSEKKNRVSRSVLRGGGRRQELKPGLPPTKMLQYIYIYYICITVPDGVAGCRMRLLQKADLAPAEAAYLPFVRSKRRGPSGSGRGATITSPGWWWVASPR